MIGAHAALLAWKSGKPVKMVYDRAEDMVATTKRHPSRTRIRSAATRDGKLLALDIDFAIDGGAYATLSAVVLSRGTIHAAGPYACPHVRVRSRAAATNAPPHGAFRGFGAPQSIFAMECHLDELAAELGLAPDELRRRNFIRKGDTLAVSQVIREEVDVPALLDQAFAMTGYYEKRERFARENAGRRVKKGIGFASFMHGAGFTGSGEEFLASIVGVDATAEGRVRVRVASTEIGQGTNTILAQIAAGALRLDYDSVDVAQPDTANVPNSGPTVASRTCMIVGRILQRCAGEMKTRLGRLTPREYLRRHGPLIITKEYERPVEMSWDDNTYQGDAYGTYGWACDVVEVEVNRDTWEVKPIEFTTVHEIGKAIHPMLAIGQIEGGSAQGIGYALLEEVVMRDGRMANAQLTNYIIPTTLDTPKMNVFVLENPYEHGPFGAKGVGEMPIDGPAPAVINALRHAGFDLREIPATPERLMLAEDGSTRRTQRE